MAAIPQNFKITIEPVSIGTLITDGDLRGGTNDCLSIPQGRRVCVIQCDSVQILGIQRYIQAINKGSSTTAVETAVNGVSP